MFISKQLVFLELQKTGTTHIRALLRELVGGPRNYIAPGESIHDLGSARVAQATYLTIHSPRGSWPTKAEKIHFATMTGTDIAVYGMPLAMAVNPHMARVGVYHLASWPDDAKAPDAMLNIATSQEALGDRRGAQKTLEALLAKYPGTPAASSAKQRLAQGPKR